MSKKNEPPERIIRVSKERVRQTAKIAKYIRILLYLGIAYMLFAQGRANGSVSDGFKVQTIKLGSQTLVVEVADNNEKRSQGLMHRKELKEGRGMLFVFDQEQPLSFWMRNTLIPLTIGYFDKDRKLFQTIDMQPASPMELHPPSYPSSRPGVYALEVPLGWYERHKIKPGTTFSFVENQSANKPRR